MSTPKHDHQPLYLSLAARIADGILADVYPEGSLLPSAKCLGEEFGINPATATRAVNLLVAAEVLEKRRGVGTVVASGAAALVKCRRLERFSANFVMPLLAEAELLDMSPNRLKALIAENCQRATAC